MSALDTTVLNGEPLGSGSRVNAYGGALVFITASRSMSAVGTLTIPAKVWHMQIAAPVVAIGTVSPIRRVKMSGQGICGCDAVGSIQSKLIVHLNPDGSPVMEVSSSFTYKVIHLVKVYGSITMTSSYTVNGVDLSRTPAPTDRISYVPNMDRISYAQRG
jgi:hypothetical protein